MQRRTLLSFLLVVLFASVASATPLYLLEGSNQGFSVFETSTGVETSIGNTGVSRLQGLDFRPGDNALFAIETFNNNGLYTINPASGFATLVGNTNIGNGPESLAFDNAGTLYVASSSGGRNLYTVDSNTAAATLLGSISGMSDVDGLTVSPVPVMVQGQGLVAANTLFAIDSGSLYTVDVNTLNATLIGNVGASETIAFDPFGTLHGVGGGNVVNQIDLLTLSSTALGSSSMSTVWGSAFEKNPVPEPTTLTLVGIGMLGLLARKRKRDH